MVAEGRRARDSGGAARRRARRACRGRRRRTRAPSRRDRRGREHLRHRDDADPAERHEDERGQPLGRVHPGEVEHEAEGRADPDDDEDRVGDGTVEGEQRERRVGARDAEAGSSSGRAGASRSARASTSTDPVIERADAEHRRQRNGVDPRGDQLPAANPRPQPGRSRQRARRRRRTGGTHPADAAWGERPLRQVCLHSTTRAVSSVGRAGDF